MTLPPSVILPVGVSSKTITLTPLANTNLHDARGAQAQVLPGAGYTVGVFSNASITIYPSQTPAGTGLTRLSITPTPARPTPAAPTSTRPTSSSPGVDTNVDFTWGTTTPFANNGYFCVRWLGQVQPQYSETYYFVANTDDGVKLWVNDQLIIDAWTNKSASDVTGTINLQGGVRYNLKMEYYQATSSDGGASFLVQPQPVQAGDPDQPPLPDQRHPIRHGVDQPADARLASSTSRSASRWSGANSATCVHRRAVAARAEL